MCVCVCKYIYNYDCSTLRSTVCQRSRLNTSFNVILIKCFIQRNTSPNTHLMWKHAYRIENTIHTHAERHNITTEAVNGVARSSIIKWNHQSFNQLYVYTFKWPNDCYSCNTNRELNYDLCGLWILNRRSNSFYRHTHTLTQQTHTRNANNKHFAAD